MVKVNVTSGGVGLVSGCQWLYSWACEDSAKPGDKGNRQHELRLIRRIQFHGKIKPVRP
jgi:hypothetical protein